MQPIIVTNNQFEQVNAGLLDQPRATFFLDYVQTTKTIAGLKEIIAKDPCEATAEFVDQLRLGQSLLFQQLKLQVGEENAELIAAKVSIDILICTE